MNKNQYVLDKISDFYKTKYKKNRLDGNVCEEMNNNSISSVNSSLDKENYVAGKISDYYKTKYKNIYKKEKIISDEVDEIPNDDSTYIYNDLDKDQIIKNKIDEYYRIKNKQNIINEKSTAKHIIEKQKGGIHKIYTSLKARICNTVANKKLKFRFNYSKLIGCSIEDFDVFIKAKFKEGMTIDNYGEWELDHIYPISKFDLTKEEEFYKCFNYQNIQPLWKTENRQKSNKIIIQ